MLKVNSYLFNTRNIYNFIDVSINVLCKANPCLMYSQEYKLFFFIKDDFFANWSWLQYADISLEFMEFPLIRRNTRHAIESFLDLHNLYSDSDYMDVLNYCSKQDKNAGKYKDYLFDGKFTIQSKCNIAKNNINNDIQYSQYLQGLVKEASECNKYTHPNVFLNIIPRENQITKANILKRLLNMNLKILTDAYTIILRKFNHGIQPYLGCCLNRNCNLCYNNSISQFHSCINNQLLVTYNPSTFNFGPI